MGRKIGHAFVRLLDAKHVIVGRDMRSHSPELAQAVIEGMRDAGCDVTDIGLGVDADDLLRDRIARLRRRVVRDRESQSRRVQRHEAVLARGAADLGRQRNPRHRAHVRRADAGYRRTAWQRERARLARALRRPRRTLLDPGGADRRGHRRGQRHGRLHPARDPRAHPPDPRQSPVHGARRQFPQPRSQPAQGGEPRSGARSGAQRQGPAGSRFRRRRRPLLLRRRTWSHGLRGLDVRPAGARDPRAQTGLPDRLRLALVVGRQGGDRVGRRHSYPRPRWALVHQGDHARERRRFRGRAVGDTSTSPTTSPATRA